MKRLIVAGVLILSGVLNAQADQFVVRWYDTIRPHGHKRANSVGQAALAHCNAAVGAYTTNVSPAYRTCMAGEGYRLMSARMRRTPISDGVVTYDKDSRDPNIGWHTEGGFRVCHQDCDNPEIPGSHYTCQNVQFMGMNMRKCSN